MNNGSSWLLTNPSVIAVEMRTKRDLRVQGWRLLKKYSAQRGLEVRVVPDRRYGAANSWPSEAWKAIYGIDLEELFSSAEEG